jgi:hypothetical protein
VAGRDGLGAAIVYDWRRAGLDGHPSHRVHRRGACPAPLSAGGVGGEILPEQKSKVSDAGPPAGPGSEKAQIVASSESAAKRDDTTPPQLSATRRSCGTPVARVKKHRKFAWFFTPPPTEWNGLIGSGRRLNVSCVQIACEFRARDDETALSRTAPSKIGFCVCGLMPNNMSALPSLQGAFSNLAKHYQRFQTAKPNDT